MKTDTAPTALASPKAIFFVRAFALVVSVSWLALTLWVVFFTPEPWWVKVVVFVFGPPVAVRWLRKLWRTAANAEAQRRAAGEAPVAR